MGDALPWGMSDPANIIAGLTALVSAVAVWVSIKVGRDAKRAANAAILNTFLSAYAAPEMHDALRTLRAFADDEGPLLHELERLRASPASLYDDDVNTAAIYAEKHEPSIGTARRHVHFFYKRAWQLWKGGYLPRSALKTIAGTSGFELLQEVVQPLSMAVNLVDVQQRNVVTFRAAAVNEFRWYDEIAIAAGRRRQTARR